MSTHRTSGWNDATSRRTIRVMPYNPEPVSKEDVGARLRLTREALRMTQARLCKLMGGGMYPSKWNNAETGDNYPQPDALSRFYQVTGANADWITRGIRDTLSPSLREAIAAHENGLATPSKRRQA